MIENSGTQWLLAMRAGDFGRAWHICDQVLAARDPATRDDPGLPYHLRWVWDGTALDGRRVLVRCYHGLGDTLQFCRYLAPLRKRVRHLAVEAQPELLPLLRTIEGVDRWIPFDPAHPAPPEDVDIEIMELGHALRQVPADVPYLRMAGGAAPAIHRDHGALLGVCWQAGGWDPARSLPLALLRAALDRPGPRLVLLQRGPAADEASVPGNPSFVNPDDRSMDVLHTARLLLACDAVVTVDTMVAHLAGALGRPTGLLLRADADWRWLPDRHRSPWYPTLCLFRQEREGDWSAPLQELGGWLHQRFPLTRASLSHEAGSL